MDSMTVKFQKLHEQASIPQRSTEGSAGMDLCARIDEPVTVPAGGRVGIPTGIAMGLPGPETVGLVFARSGLAVKHGLALSNGVGVIDSDYTGEIRVGLVNLSDKAYTIEPGERIAQLVIMPVLLPEVELVEALEETARGAGGFGSTGRK